ncbi:MAG: Gfo/Idh/MocA family oxidoreductase, partial [Treponema sp.]|nr:Gfo/Idh/MocA family oxidoreductase [Treponema sp.]
MSVQRIGIVGCGNISGIYLKNLTGMFGKRVRVTALTDLIPERAEKASAEYKIPYIKKTEDLINSSDVDIILNITEPYNHYGVSLAAVKAGKHIYTEKPICAMRDEAQEVLKIAAEKKLRVGNSPDTFLGAGIQTCRKLMDDGWIGQPVAAVAFMVGRGHEHWHPGPEFYYKKGGGPMFDMGPYYLTALVNLIGPVRSEEHT